ncbi:MAG: tRNA lysidine(34) synthetase TilS [Lachnospiraceae bacterium]|nr:tRNA lysidine(34) synthetase TilS [Lachnospiraceae bacterium]
MIHPGDVIGAGVSGGADSVCLLLMLSELKEKMGFNLFVVNVEHGIRGEESLSDSTFVEELCKKMRVPFYRYDVNVPALAEELKISLEEAARKARYEAFGKACREHGATGIAIAHNMDDNAETVIHNMARGTSLTGLAGIRPVRDDIIRPLLCLTRSEIEEYLAAKGASFRTDSTNLSDEYTRNKIRHRIIPELENLNPGAPEHIMALSEDVSDALSVLGDLIARKKDGMAKNEAGEWRIDISLLDKEADYVQREIVKSLMASAAGGSKDIGRVHVNDALALCHKETGSRCSLSMGVEAEREYDSLIIRKTASEDKGKNLDISVPVSVPGATDAGNISLRTSFADKNAIKIEKKTYTKLIDCDKIKGRLFLRHRRTGDMLAVNEAGGRISIKDYFINEKIPRSLRDKIWLLCDEEQVIWIVGYRLSEAFKIKEETVRVLELEITEK